MSYKRSGCGSGGWRDGSVTKDHTEIMGRPRTKYKKSTDEYKTTKIKKMESAKAGTRRIIPDAQNREKRTNGRMQKALMRPENTGGSKNFNEDPKWKEYTKKRSETMVDSVGQ